MHSEGKLAEAKYFLDLLRVAPQDPTHEKEFMYEVSAFLSSWRSVIDVILYDYAEKFNFGFSRDEGITVRDFEVAARVTRNNIATEFIEWLNQQTGSLSNNPLWRKRNVIVHRGYPPTMHVYSVYVSGSIFLSSSVTVRSSTSPVSAGSSGFTPLTTNAQGGSAIPTTTPTTTTAEIRFLDCQDKSVIAYCQEAFDQMERIVNLAIQKFGR